ncbi:MAG TPA: phospholipid carrier-dependent glycosyltransferase [Desulfuromonadaceae bacterium]|jgi:4-amino-4-deoxy-L-arabinose transferase-like glycosyltransferase
MRDLKAYSQSNNSWLRDLLCLAFLLAIPFIQFLGRLPLIDPDEGRYAEIPREMLEKGDFITPTLNYVKYFEKPPLLYWLNAGSLKLFGVTEFAARLPSALCGLLTVLATYVIASQLYNRRTALISALILATSTGFVLQSRIILTDMLLTCCLTAALGAFIIAAQREGRRSKSLPWYLFYLFCALAVLAKGLIGIVFPAGIIFFYLLLGCRWKLLREMRLLSGLLLFLAIASPWFVAVSLANPEFARFFFIHEHFERFTSTVHGRYQPVWFFLPVLLGTMLPWSFFIPGALIKAWRDRYQDQIKSSLYLLIWTSLIFLFFSKSNSKLIPYILPIFPPLAILIACRIDNQTDKQGRGLRLSAIMLGIAVFILGAAITSYPQLPHITTWIAELMPQLGEPLRRFVNHAPQISTAASLTIGILFLLQGIGVLIFAGRNTNQILLVLCLSAFLLEILVPRLIMGEIARTESPRALAVKANSLAGPDTRLVTIGPWQAVSWYTGRRLVVAGTPDELEFGSKQGNQSAWFVDFNSLVRLWKENGQVLVFLRKNELEVLLPLLQPKPHIQAEAGKNILISNW